MTGIPGFDDAPADSAEWVAHLQKRLGWRDREKVNAAFLATMHALRDQLPANEAALLGNGLPILLRGLYFEGWYPHGKPLRLEDREMFLLRLHEALHRELGIDPEEMVRAVLEVLSERVPPSDLEEIRAACPAPLHGLWPD